MKREMRLDFQGYGNDEIAERLRDIAVMIENGFTCGINPTWEIDDEKSPQGDFVNDGSHYQFMDYVFQSTINSEGFSSLDVYDFEDNHIGELDGVTLPDEDDREAILNFESLLTAWLKDSNLI